MVNVKIELEAKPFYNMTQIIMSLNSWAVFKKNKVLVK